MTPKEYRSLKAEAKRIGLPIPDERFGRNRAGANNIRLFWVSNGKEHHRDFAVLREARAAVPANATDWSIHEVWHPSFPGRVGRVLSVKRRAVKHRKRARTYSARR